MKTPDNEHLPCFPETKFMQWHRNFSAEAEALSGYPAKSFAERVWEDSCDIGFWMQSEDGSELFTLVDVRRDSNGDITKWLFKSASDDGKVVCTIFND